MKPNDPMEGAKWNAPSHGNPTDAWLATRGFVPRDMQKPTASKPLPKPAPKAGRRSKR